MKKKDKEKNKPTETKNFIFEKWPGHLQVFFNGKEYSFLCNPKSTFDELTACSAFFTSEIMRIKTLNEQAAIQSAIQVTETPVKKEEKKKEEKKPEVKKPKKKLWEKKEKKK